MSNLYTKLSLGSSDLTDESALSASPQPPRKTGKATETKEKTDTKPQPPATANGTATTTTTSATSTRVDHLEKVTRKKRTDSNRLFHQTTTTTANYGEKDRKVSTGTLNRLILVAQALESEVDARRQSDISGTKITFSIRMANLILLLMVNILIFTGVGKYQAHQNGGYRDLLLTADKWAYDNKSDDYPETFALMQLSGQYLAACISVFLLFSTILLQLLHICSTPTARLTEMCYSFGAVPVSLFVFGLEMHYSTCPWVDEYFAYYDVVDKSAQCAINGWALAGIFSLLSCGLFVSEGLIAAFFSTDANRTRKETVV